MKGRSLLALSVLSLALACEGAQQTTAPNAPDDASKIIRDGAHSGGNKDFFFLPPMVPLPLHNPDFQLGKFNNTLRPSLKIVICELVNEYNAQHVQILPTDNAVCGATKKTFAPGSVQLVNLPLRQNGWWTLFGLPPDGFYYVLWDTRQSNLSVGKYYRIKVFVDGKPDELGIADVDPMGSLREWKYSLTGQVIQLVDDVMLPITFRVEQGALCETGTTCTSASYTNTAPLTLPYDPDLTGSTAGVTIPAGALPTPQNSPTFCTVTNPCPTTVTVKITKVNTGGEGQSLCHPDIPELQQFKGCYEFTTIPELRRLNELGDQFVTNVLVAVCYELEGSGDPREKFAQLYQSGGEEPSKWLDDVHEGVLIGGDTQDCTPTVIGSRSSNPLIQFASSGWRAVKGGLGKVFGVKTAYAIDLGLGGLTKGFSHISPVLRVGIAPASSTDLTLAAGEYSTNVSAKIVARHFHTEVAPGVGNVPVTFAVTEGNGTIKLVTDEGPGGTVPITVNTASPAAGVPIPGIASVTWTLPGPGTFTMTASGPAYDGPITYSVTVPMEAWSGAGTIATTGLTPFGGSPFCTYTVELTNVQASLDLNASGGGTGTATATQVERLAPSPCGSIEPAPVHLDHYSSTSVTRVGNHVTATFAPVSNPISASLQFDGTIAAGQQTLSGTFTWHRTDQGPPLNWTIVSAGTLTKGAVVVSEIPNPVLAFVGASFQSGFVQYDLTVTNYASYPAEMFVPRSDLPPCGLNTSASRTWVYIYNASNNAYIYGYCAFGSPSNMQTFSFSIPTNQVAPDQVYVTLTDRASNVVYTSNIVTVAPPP